MRVQSAFIISFLLSSCFSLPINKSVADKTYLDLYLSNDLSLILRGKKNETADKTIDYFSYEIDTPHMLATINDKVEENGEKHSKTAQIEYRLNKISTQLDSFVNETSFDSISFELCEDTMTKELSDIDQETSLNAKTKSSRRFKEQFKIERDRLRKMSVSANILKRLAFNDSPGLPIARNIVALELQISQNHVPESSKAWQKARENIRSLWKAVPETTKSRNRRAWRRLKELWKN